jgi:integrase
MRKSAQFSKSKVPCLVRHRAGTYYASAKVGGKVIRRSLETDDFNKAKARLPKVLAAMRGAPNAREAGSLAAAITAEAHRQDPTLKQTTAHYYQQTAKALLKVAVSMEDDPSQLSVARITVAHLRPWMDLYARSVSPTRFNGSLALLRRTFARAMEAGHAAGNPADALKRIVPKQRKHDLPTPEDFAAIVANIIAQRKSHSKATAAAVEFLAYTGMRISEANAVRWSDIKNDHIINRTAKNDRLRQVPLIPACKRLLDRLKAAGVPHGPDDPVMLVRSPRIALAAACERLGIHHMRVHDLRHIFATRCIESGVDLPTIAGWLGHSDGGALAAKVYGHLCRRHSMAQAAKVRI